MGAWHQWAANQTQQAATEHQQTNREEWNNLGEEAGMKNNALAFKFIRGPQELAKGYIRDEEGNRVYDAKVVLQLIGSHMGNVVGRRRRLARR